MISYVLSVLRYIILANLYYMLKVFVWFACLPYRAFCSLLGCLLLLITPMRPGQRLESPAYPSLPDHNMKFPDFPYPDEMNYMRALASTSLGYFMQGVVFLGVIALLMFGLSKLYTYAFRRSDAAVPATNPEPQSLLPAQRVHGMNQPENTSGAPRRGLHFQFGDDAAESVQTVASDHSNESRSNRFRL